jgi:hypothetical protein
LCSGRLLVYHCAWEIESADVTSHAQHFLWQPPAVQSSFKVHDLMALMRECLTLQENYTRWFVGELLDDADLATVKQTGTI